MRLCVTKVITQSGCWQEIGVGGTSAWKICGLDPSTSLTMVMEVSNQVYAYISHPVRESTGLTLLFPTPTHSATRQHPSGSGQCTPIHHFLPTLVRAEEGEGDHHSQTVRAPADVDVHKLLSVCMSHPTL